MLACKFLLAERVPEMSPMRLACSALSLNSFWDSLKSCSFSCLISFSTSSFICSDSLYSFSASWFTCSSCSQAVFSLPSLSLVAANFFLAASRRCIFSAKIMLIEATLVRLLLSSVAKAESQFLRIATSPSNDFLSSIARVSFSLSLASSRSQLQISPSVARLFSRSLSSLYLCCSRSAFFASNSSLS